MPSSNAQHRKSGPIRYSAEQDQQKAKSAPAPSLLGRMVRKPTTLALAAALGAGAIGTSLMHSTQPATAQSTARSVITPYGAAPLSFADLVEQVKPAVVSIAVTGEVKSVSNNSPRGGQALPNLPEDSPLNEFFKRFRRGAPNGGQAPRSRPRNSQGSGFFISRDGYVVTNNHVVNGAKKIKVTMDDKSTYDAKVIGVDARTDLALLKVDESRTFPFVRFTSKQARVGDWALAVGNPFGLGGTVTAGIVSAKSRDIGSGPYDYLQIDAAVNRGNSGGPTFNLEGEVIGVNTAIFSPSGGNVGIAFAVPANLAIQVIEKLKSFGTVNRGWLGVRIQNVTEDIAASLGLKKASGALVARITKDGPAEKSDLRVGDAIMSVNGTKIDNSRDLARKVAELNPNTDANIIVLRDGREKDVVVRLGTFPSGKRLASIQKPSNDNFTPEKTEALGLSLTKRTGKDSKKPGVVVSDVKAGTSAADKGIREGDVVIEISGVAVNSPSDVTRGVEKARKRGRSAVLLRLKSGDQERFVALPVDKG